MRKWHEEQKLQSPGLLRKTPLPAPVRVIGLPSSKDRRSFAVFHHRIDEVIALALGPPRKQLGRLKHRDLRRAQHLQLTPIPCPTRSSPLHTAFSESRR